MNSKAILIIIVILILLVIVVRLGARFAGGGASPTGLDDCEITGTQVYPNISYGSNAKQRFDLHVPEGSNSQLPLIVFVHGGAWAAGDKKQFDCASAFLAKSGYAVANINYRLLPSKYPAPLEDIQSVLLWAKDNASQYNINTSKVGMTGHSAGAHLTALYALTQDKGYVAGGSSAPQVLVAAPMAGVYSLENIEESILKNLTYDRWIQGASDPALGVPVQQIDSQDTVKFLLLHGSLDSVAPPEQPDLFSAALLAAGKKVTVKKYPFLNHGTLVNSIHTNNNVAQDLVSFFNSNLK